MKFTEAKQLTDGDGQLIAQVLNQTSDEFEPLTKPSTEETLLSAKALLEVLKDKDFATQATLTLVLNALQSTLITRSSGKYVGYSTDAKPVITDYTPGMEITFLELDTGCVSVYDGTDWVVI